MAYLDRSKTLVSTLIAGAIVLASGCASATGVDGSESRTPVMAMQSSAPSSVEDEGRSPLPSVGACEDERTAIALDEGDDDRCAREIAVAAASAFLYVGSLAAGGEEMSVATVDPAYALEDALDDDEFQRMFRRADAAPRDGVLERHEARELERRVAKFVESR